MLYHLSRAKPSHNLLCCTTHPFQTRHFFLCVFPHFLCIPAITVNRSDKFSIVFLFHFPTYTPPHTVSKSRSIKLKSFWTFIFSYLEKTVMAVVMTARRCGRKQSYNHIQMHSTESQGINHYISLHTCGQFNSVTYNINRRGRKREKS